MLNVSKESAVLPGSQMEVEFMSRKFIGKHPVLCCLSFQVLQIDQTIVSSFLIH